MANIGLRRVGALLWAALLLRCLFFPAASMAVSGVILYQEGASAVRPGDASVAFDMKLANSGQQSFGGVTIEIGKADGVENVTSAGGADSLGAGQTNTYSFKADISRGAASGIISLPIDAYYNDGGGKKLLAEGAALFNVARSSSSSADYSSPVMDLRYALSNPVGLTAGESTILTITVMNRGASLIQDLRVGLELPAELSLGEGLALRYAGNLEVTEEKSVSFPVFADKGIENKNYAVTVNLSGFSGGATNAKQTLFIPVVGGKQETETKPVRLEISGVSLPSGITAGDDFTLRFSVSNVGEGELAECRISAAPDQGIANKTGNLFVAAKVAPGERRDYSVTFSTPKDLAEKSYLIQISAEASGAEGPVAFNQYASLFVAKAEEQSAGGAGTPRLIVSGYDYGGGSVKAGSEFTLRLSLVNTNARPIGNIKASLEADGGALIPVGSSNSIFIGSLPGGESATREMRLAASPTAEQKTTGMTVRMYYEDEDGNAYNASDIISIPVIQETVLSVDDVIAPPDVFVGNPSGLDIRFYNTGKTILANLRVTAEGNFDLTDSEAYYVGNMASGANDSYSLSFVPREEGLMEGRVVFTFDDPSGNPQRIEKEFSLTVGPMPQMEGPEIGTGEPAPAPTGIGRRHIAAIGGGALLLLVLALMIRRGLKRRRMNREMEMDLE